VLIGATIRPEALPALIQYFPAIVGVLVLTVVFSILAGMVLAKIGPLSRETATLGTLPGGASAMTVLSVETGADTAVVALMQYLRLLLVVGTSVTVASFLAPHGSAAHPSTGLGLVVPDVFTLVATPGLAIAGAVLGRLVRLPTPALLGPMLLCLTASALGWVHPLWFPGVAQAAYIILGLYVGQLFDRRSLIQARRLLPLLLANIFVLLVFCALVGLGFAALLGTSPLTGYLATSPGGGDTIAIIALGSGADLSLVFTVQMFRALSILFSGPFLVRAILKFTGVRHVP
jgi:membrane AbrB-like protein